MGTQLIFCMETNKQAKTDWVYINETIKRFYASFSHIDVKFSPIYMGSKSKYNAKDTQKQIKDLTKRYNGKSHIIICVDTDDFDICNNDQKLNNAIANYCVANGYDFVWFCRDIEEVYIGNAISKDQKVKTAKTFRSRAMINAVDEEKLRASSFIKIHSNILLILDKYLRNN